MVSAPVLARRCRLSESRARQGSRERDVGSCLPRRAKSGTALLFPQLKETDDRLHHVEVGGLEIVEALPDGGAARWDRAGLVEQLVEASHSFEPDLERARDDVGRDGVIVTPVAWSTRALEEAELLEAARVGADAGLGDAERRGHVVERAFARLDEQEAEDASRDAGQPVSLGEKSHALDKASNAIVHSASISGQRGSSCFQYVQSRLNTLCLVLVIGLR